MANPIILEREIALNGFTNLLSRKSLLIREYYESQPTVKLVSRPMKAYCFCMEMVIRIITMRNRTRVA